ncbi:hypothetical protein [Chitinophaga vietnamensis]|uniref:hypothetical protein n=1 Tax=Chitinophaga vietnamensis TaxID=2593957 RepID=UPI001178A12A|nr:hypothetical protein [Chitinophaga vietnamensis]
MRKLYSLIAALLFAVPLLAQQYNNYFNARFHISMLYPKDFTAQPESFNGDGRKFVAKDGQAEIITYGSLVLEETGTTTSQQFEDYAFDLKVAYKVIKPDYLIMSGTNRDGNIVYRKTLKRKISYPGDTGKNTWVWQTVMITYPPSQQAQYADYCKYIAQQFK